MKKLLATLPLLALLSCTGIPPQHALSHFDWTEPADPQGEKPETWNGVEKPIVTFGSTDVRYPRATPCAAAVTDQTTLTGWRGEKVSAQAVISAPAAVGGLPGILSIQPTYWQVYAMAMAIAVVVPIILTSVVYQRKYRQGTLQIV